MSIRTLKTAKQSLRKEMKKRLKSLPLKERSRESNIVTEKLLSLDVFEKSRSLSLYLSMPSEVHTNDIMKRVFECNKKCFIPHYTTDSMRMVLLSDQADYDALPVTSWNIKQPADDDVRADVMDEGGLDLIVVPGLGFTPSGLRLGRGKGYYDNYFRSYVEKFQKRPYLVGLAYSCQMVDNLPADEFDVKLDQVLYPS